MPGTDGGGREEEGIGDRGGGREGLQGWSLTGVVGWKQTKSTTSNENSAILIHSSSFQTSYKGTAPHNYPPLFTPPPSIHPASFTFLNRSLRVCERNHNQYFIVLPSDRCVLITRNYQIYPVACLAPLLISSSSSVSTTTTFSIRVSRTGEGNFLKLFSNEKGKESISWVNRDKSCVVACQ